MRFAERPIAITDIETTGLDADIHEIVELGLLIVDQKTLRVQDQYHARIRPIRIKTAAKRALEISGYNPRAWATAVDLETAMTVYAQKARTAIFCSYNLYLANSFMDAAFKMSGVEDPTDYHRLDLFTLAWSRLGPGPANLDSICRRLNIVPEPVPRRAMDGALKQLEVLRALSYR
jgi:DNA polymerase III alpha subunit (gram-positive type)